MIVSLLCFEDDIPGLSLQKLAARLNLRPGGVRQAFQFVLSDG